MTVDMDDVWREIGLGRYQVLQYLLWFFQVFFISIHTLSVVFLGYRPPYRCAEVNVTDINPEYNPDNTHVHYDKCHVIVYTGDVTNGTNASQTLSCPNGYNYDQAKYTTFVTEFDLVCSRASLAELTQSLFMVGHLFGSLVFPQLSDKYGRRLAVQVCGSLMFAVNMAQAFSPNILILNILRLLSGFFCQGVQQIYILFLESLPTEKRYLLEVIGMGIWVTTITSLGLLGYLFKDLSWRYFQLAITVGLVHVVFVHLGLDESARWLVANGKIKEAIKVIKKASRMNGKECKLVMEKANFKEFEIKDEAKCKNMNIATIEEVTEYKFVCTLNCEKDKNDNSSVPNMAHKDCKKTRDVIANIKDKSLYEKHKAHTCKHSDNSKKVKDSFDDCKKYTVFSIMKDKRILINSLILWFIWVTNEFTYFGIFLTSFSLSGNRFINHGLLSIVDVPIMIVQYFLLNRCGRKILAMAYQCLTAVCLFISTILTNLNDEEDTYGYVILAITLLGKFGIGGSFSVLWIYTPEMYPTNIRAVGMGIASMVGKIGAITTPFMANFVDVLPWGPGVLFSAMCFVATIFYWFLPETLGNPLPTTIQELKKWHRGTLKHKQLEDFKEIIVPPPTIEENLLNLKY